VDHPNPNTAVHVAPCCREVVPFRGIPLFALIKACRVVLPVRIEPTTSPLPSE
jgi:hypothetical protein